MKLDESSGHFLQFLVLEFLDIKVCGGKNLLDIGLGNAFFDTTLITKL